MENKYLTISAVTKYIKYKFDTDNYMKKVYIRGEVSNFKAHTAGHLYFSLKDDTSKINAIMFSSSSKNLKFTPKDGTNVFAIGRISVYEATGNYQIYVDEMIEDGVGDLYKEFEKLKENLEKEGLFNPEHKKPIPKYPTKIGVITAHTGAAIRDIVTTLKRRYNIAEIFLFPSLVQGENAYLDIVKKLKQADDYDLDVIILGRGGGSIEDLWPFNKEEVARTIFTAKTPIISAVGHEVDFTIADFVADLRAPTPTAAAELAVPSKEVIINDLLKYKKVVYNILNEKLEYKKIYLEKIKTSYVLKNPWLMYENKVIRLDNIKETINNLTIDLVKANKFRLDNIKNNIIFRKPEVLYNDSFKELSKIVEKLEVLNPISVLNRGYSLTYHNDKPLKDVKEVNSGDEIITRLNKGYIKSKIINKGEKNEI